MHDVDEFVGVRDLQLEHVNELGAVTVLHYPRRYRVARCIIS